MSCGRLPFLRRRNPAVKLVALIVLILSLTVVFDPWTPALFLLVSLLSGRLLGGLALRRLLRMLLLFLPGLLGILLANVLFNRLNDLSAPLLVVGPLAITEPALRTAASLGFRLLAFASFSAVFVLTTEPDDLILSLVHQARLQYRVAYATLVGYRMLPLLRRELETIRAAHRVRGIEERPGPLRLLRRPLRYALPLLTGAVRRAGRIAMAMDARAFGAYPDRTYRRRMSVDRGDRLFLLAVLVTIALLIGGLWLAGLASVGIGV